MNGARSPVKRTQGDSLDLFACSAIRGLLEVVVSEEWSHPQTCRHLPLEFLNFQSSGETILLSVHHSAMGILLQWHKHTMVDRHRHSFFFVKSGLTQQLTTSSRRRLWLKIWCLSLASSTSGASYVTFCLSVPFYKGEIGSNKYFNPKTWEVQTGARGVQGIRGCIESLRLDRIPAQPVSKSSKQHGSSLGLKSLCASEQCTEAKLLNSSEHGEYRRPAGSWEGTGGG